MAMHVVAWAITVLMLTRLSKAQRRKILHLCKGGHGQAESMPYISRPNA